MNATATPLSPLAPYAATLLRLALGVLFLVHALTKLLVFTPAGTAAFFESLGLPGVLGYLTIAVELTISAALLLGIYARWIGLLGVPLLLGTIVTVHGANGFSFANTGGGWEYPAFWALALVVLFLLGDGRWTLRSR
ncbi:MULTISPECIES: DoxX family protein [Stenotrophomonas]|uniref:DoxX family protein n=1 Tax=Stenotrophomonas lactitubi TaxID=2045214 RepID=A0AAW4GM15_9GAMM|nr:MULTISPECIES: DoxX family protein [Stenotrophomonas]MBM9915120.1 DoxX family protein [Stenotrophomonas lactitubi]MBM9922781.1 DoxX family protein [Stenotrophomonas lactitubi]MBM9937387.1 DoxX family protein [Stenotrophomonas lactitubi]PJO50231.1 LysR family transcriptional regulator [Stenotrophomonas lactitubi]